MGLNLATIMGAFEFGTFLKVAGAVGLVILIGGIFWFMSLFKKVEQGKAMIINKFRRIVVTFSGGFVIPVIHKSEFMNIAVKTIEIDRRGKNGLICMDNIRADITVNFYIRVNKTEEDVLKVAQMVGCDRASDIDVLEELFSAKFSEALKTVGKQMDFEELYTKREAFNEQIMNTIGRDLNGYVLEDAAIDFLEQTPIQSLDDRNILDAQGIKKITKLTVEEHIFTNDRLRHEEKEKRRQDVEAIQAILELDRQEAEASARQKREIAAVEAREEAEARKVQEEERQKAENARIAADESVMVAEENKQRQVEIAVKNKERAIAVENERVIRDRDLEATERERLVAIKEIQKEKDVEVEKKLIQEVIRERVALERTVAEEEERIKDVRVLSEADRIRQAEIIDAEREAARKVIEVTKEAEGKEQAAKHIHEELVTLADAELLKSQKIAEAEKITAEGTIAKESAQGMAHVKVEKAEAEAIEVKGKAEAIAMRERMRAEADGVEFRGTAEGVATRDRVTGEADGIAAKGTAEGVAIRETRTAEAVATETQGKADAVSMREKYTAEADGINAKADAMKNFDGVGREHEEFKLRLGLEEKVKIRQIDISRDIAAEQAKIMGEAMKSANIDIVGGGGDFLDKFFKSVTLAKSVDGFVENSQVASKLLDGESKIGEQLKDLIEEVGIDSEGIKNLTVSALLAKMALQATGDSKGKVETLKDQVEKMGLQDLMALYLAK